MTGDELGAAIHTDESWVITRLIPPPSAFGYVRRRPGR